jgi:methylated-DNA-[protein]-cysteine S-methyltransferase
MKRIKHFSTYLGELGVAEMESRITYVYLPGERPTEPTVEEENTLLNEAAEQIKAYLAGQRRTFDLPLAPEGSPFSLMVWNALLEIPYAEVRSYSSIATAVGRPGGARAVGQACNANPIPLIIPCHRVIGSGGRLTGYAGGVEIKESLLELERRLGKP